MIVRKFYFYDCVDDCEVLSNDVVTIPDQSLSVRDIITRFTRGQMELPPIEYGDDEDIDSDFSFEDDIDAFDAYNGGLDLASRFSEAVQESQGQESPSHQEQESSE